MAVPCYLIKCCYINCTGLCPTELPFLENDHVLFESGLSDWVTRRKGIWILFVTCCSGAGQLSLAVHITNNQDRH